MRSSLFWSSAGLILYTYVGYPLLALIRAVVRPRPYHSAAITPSVSIVIAAYNEQASIEEKLRNCLALDYPSELLEIIVASDGSVDGTNEIVSRYADQGVRLLALPRSGKAAALDAAVAQSSGEILVFSDANSAYEARAIRALVAPFSDSSVGGVAGNQRYLPGTDADAAAEGERAYWNFERVLKEAESRSGNTIAATGAIYAIRRSLFQGVLVGVTDDFAVSTSVIGQGYRLVYAGDAVAWEPVSKSGATEWGRKVRVTTRGLRGVYERRQLLDPRRSGFYAVQLFSHKVLRRLMGVPLLILAITAPSLWTRGWIYRLATIAQAAFYTLGAVGMAIGSRSAVRHPVFGVPQYFILANAAALLAAWNVLTGRRIDRWEPVREGGPDATSDATGTATSTGSPDQPSRRSFAAGE